ncbi:hypothetical protein JKA74_04365 [Marivirga sp. S37H4]|uniref:Phosphatidate cytidylyltransferase n=1 Tax=Marivirga aurantiaca TaxID=2802615 RepID=A0A934WWS5_9BACT|nr:hypothetical protein [Marivirga aurantiaca]MBK6264260.1 hypothetical protein [Marivirga aurantiaca]
MKRLKFSQLMIFLLLLVTVTGCDLAAGIFEAGVWVGIIVVILVIALIIWVIKKIFD